MEPTTQNIVDLVTITVKNLGGDANSVQCNGGNILVGDKPIPIWRILACRNSARGFVDLIKEVLL